jgi:hypothetical protein
VEEPARCPMERRSVDSPASSSKAASCLDMTRIGPGAARASASCVLIYAQPITPEEIEYEVQFAFDGATPGLDRFHLL